MNERIRQLLNEATVGLEPDLSTHTTITHNELAKFAELIVKECINVISESREVRQTAYYYRNRLAEHFGVEE